MKNAVATIAFTLMSVGGISCSQLLTKTPATTGGYADSGQSGYYGQGQPLQTGQPARTGQTQGGYYDQAQVYPQPGTTTGNQANAAQPAYNQYQAPAYQTPTYQSPAPSSYQQQAYTPPAPTYTPPAYTGSSTSGQTHTVQKGENLYRISQMHGTSVQNLMSVNGLSSDVIYPGDVLTVR